LRLHSRLIVLNLAAITVIAFLLRYFSRDAPIEGHIALLVLVGAGLTLISSYAAYALASRPLRHLAKASQELAAGALNTEIPVPGDPDLQAVGAAMKAMARNLQRRIDELEEGRRGAESIVAVMSAGVVVFDAEARVVVANRASGRLLGATADLTGKAPLELVRDPALDEAVRKALRGEDVPAVDLTTGGRVLLVNATALKSSAGRVERVVVVLHDLTEIRRTERMRKDFIANVSHEFKTPLTSIRGYAETLLNSAPQDPKLVRDFLGAIERNSALLQALVDDLLVLARLESEPPVEKQEIHLQELIQQQILARQHWLREREIRVEIDCPEMQVLADRSRLTRALSNLIDNAIHYNRPGGSVRITARRSGAGFAVDVADTGIGIRQEDLARVFERFYRVEKSRTRESGGTGLGLAIAKHAVESQGGAVSVSSKVGAGSTFTIVLPACGSLPDSTI